MRLLVVEDNQRLAAFIAKALRAEGISADLVGLADEADAALSRTRYDCVVLDLGLPDRDGTEVLKGLRGRGDQTPVLILTARDGLTARAEGLSNGADDFLLKPFATAELIARLKVLMRRPGGALGASLQCGNLVLDTIGSVVAIDSKPLLLAGRELALIELLLRRAGGAVTKSAIEERLSDLGEEIQSNTVEVDVSGLRTKLAEAGAAIEIHTIQGVGYLLSEERR